MLVDEMTKTKNKNVFDCNLSYSRARRTHMRSFMQICAQLKKTTVA